MEDNIIITTIIIIVIISFGVRFNDIQSLFKALYSRITPGCSQRTTCVGNKTHISRFKENDLLLVFSLNLINHIFKNPFLNTSSRKKKLDHLFLNDSRRAFGTLFLRISLYLKIHDNLFLYPDQYWKKIKTCH